MKRIFFTTVSIIFFCIVIVALNSCEKKDTGAPIVTLTGASTMRVSLNGTFTDPGATSEDDVDGADVITSNASLTNPNMNLAGTYNIIYSSVDNAGNAGRAVRKVIVSNDAAKYAGSYLVNDVITGKKAGTYNYIVTVNPSTTVNKYLFLENFSGLGGAVTVSAVVSSSSITLGPATQSPTGMTDPGSIKNGTGTATADTIRSFNYRIDYNSTGSDTGTSTWTKL